MLQPNERIGPYTLIKQLGRGAFGIVWLAERRGEFATTKVALKLTLDDDPDLASIRQESQLWAQLGGHANVLPIIEADRYDGQVVIVSEFAPDGSLENWLKQHGGKAPSIESAVAMAQGILSGLAHLHGKAIVHRDLKPANILLQGDTPRLADFGLARVLKSSQMTAGVAGTPAYMSPENFNGERSAQSDLWSVGVILYQMLTGRMPFAQTDMIALIGAIATREPEPLPESFPTLLRQIVMKALQKDPAARFSSAVEMRAMLATALINNSVSSSANISAGEATVSQSIHEAPTLKRPQIATVAAAESDSQKITERNQVARSTNSPINGPATVPAAQLTSAPPPATAEQPSALGKPLLIGGALVVVALLGLGIWKFTSQPTTTGSQANVSAPAQPTISPKLIDNAKQTDALLKQVDEQDRRISTMRAQLIGLDQTAVSSLDTKLNHLSSDATVIKSKLTGANYNSDDVNKELLSLKTKVDMVAMDLQTAQEASKNKISPKPKTTDGPAILPPPDHPLPRPPLPRPGQIIDRRSRRSD